MNELLIVNVVIALLAAISIVAYSGIQTRAKQSIQRNDLVTLGKQLRLFKIDDGNYPDNFVEFSSIMQSAGVRQFTGPSASADVKKNFILCVGEGEAGIAALNLMGESNKYYNAPRNNWNSKTGYTEAISTSTSVNNIDICNDIGIVADTFSAQSNF